MIMFWFVVGGLAAARRPVPVGVAEFPLSAGHQCRLAGGQNRRCGALRQDDRDDVRSRHGGGHGWRRRRLSPRPDMVLHERCTSMATLNELDRDVLIEGLADWINVWMVVGMIGNDTKSPRARNEAVQAIGSLIERRLVMVGDIGAAGFQPWLGNTKKCVDRLHSLIREPHSSPAHGDLAWLANTPAGDEAAREALTRSSPPESRSSRVRSLSAVTLRAQGSAGLDFVVSVLNRGRLRNV